MALHAGYAFGRPIFSPFVLPWLPSEGLTVLAGDSEGAIEISRGDATLGQVDRACGSYAYGRGGLRISATEDLSFLCEPCGRSIRVEAGASLSDDIIASHLAANAIPAALWLQGERLLHAGAVRLSGNLGAVLIAGDSGAGKSTVLAECLASGASLAAEDSCLVRPKEQGVSVAGFPGQIQLRRDEQVEDRAPGAVSLAQQVPELNATALVTIRKDHVVPEAAPVEMHGVAKLQALLRQRYRPVLPWLLGREPEDLPVWAECAARLSVYSWNPRLVQRADWVKVLTQLTHCGDEGGLD